jgi:hypothetical protein
MYVNYPFVKPVYEARVMLYSQPLTLLVHIRTNQILISVIWNRVFNFEIRDDLRLC